ncbi:hypothetical protein X802_02310 [Thermococcus guaymasensis DSM 11113]|uniref:Uncharacterized protein n=1 Tax=Thermococcus guaymasensis DSM 11113 TaxID=1432656 RepID=A0A0X1KIS0_9EURY|nr:hypothetical protein [Thermococcus guaymasensis]AJC71140.1 hypothetical protein X802_02310 [Thermococcus guaymasensis DSM 11113]
MVVRLGYKDKLVYVENSRVYLFKGRLYSAPLEEALRAAYSEDALVPPEIREIAPDLAEVLGTVPRTSEERQIIEGIPREQAYA